MSESLQPVVVPVERRLNLIRNLPSFETLEWSVLQNIAENTGVEFFEQGAEVVHEGAVGDRMYLIERGVVGISVEGATGSIQLGTLGEGEIFGEIALLNEGRRRSATVTTLCSVVVITLDWPHFERIAIIHPEVRADLECAASELMQNRLEALMKAKGRKMDEIAKNPLGF